MPAIVAALLAAALAAAASPAPGTPEDAGPVPGPPAAAGQAGGGDAGAPGPRAPVTLPETVVRTGTRSPRPTSALPTTVEVLPGARLEASAGSTPDALLRTLPSFQNFRRSTSLAADPSSQGLSLRGVGPSAVSRALLLDDGVPANDPFGGWIAWRALPRLGVERIEVAPGGASALYGSFALGGVVAVVPRTLEAAPPGGEAEGEVSGGGAGTWNAAARAARRAGAVGGELEAETLRTDGYPVVAPWDRGAVDRPAGADHAAGRARLRWDAGPGLALTAGATAFQEDQDGGTRFTRSAARLLSGRAGLEAEGGLGRLEAVLYAGARRFDQDRARFGPERATEALAARQRVPSSDLGGSLVWSAPARGALRLTAGADLRRVAGAARETLFPATAAADAAVAREAEGSQLLGGVFAEGGAALAPGLELSAALRVDLWRNGEATGLRRAADGGEDRTRYAPRSDAQVSPRVALLWRPGQGPLALRASAYRAFRAPTLNELYRTFQVGTVVTAPDPSLRAETLLGAEAGPELALRGGALRLRATGFWSVLRDPITVVTLDAPLPDGATRRRANLGAARIRGLEATAAWAPLPWLEARAAWTFVDARVASAPGHPELTGRALPQDPRHRAALSLAAWRAGVGRLGAELRAVSRQYEDDRNALPMGGYVLLDLAASVPLRHGLEAFAAAENVLDRRYLVGRAGVDTTGAPRMVRAGLRVRMGGE